MHLIKGKKFKISLMINFLRKMKFSFFSSSLPSYTALPLFAPLPFPFPSFSFSPNLLSKLYCKCSCQKKLRHVLDKRPIFSIRLLISSLKFKTTYNLYLLQSHEIRIRFWKLFQSGTILNLHIL